MCKKFTSSWGGSSKDGGKRVTSISRVEDVMLYQNIVGNLRNNPSLQLWNGELVSIKTRTSTRGSCFRVRISTPSMVRKQSGMFLICLKIIHYLMQIFGFSWLEQSMMRFCGQIFWPQNKFVKLSIVILSKSFYNHKFFLWKIGWILG